MNEPKLEKCPGPWTAVLMTSHKSRAYGATYYKVVDKNRNNVCCYIADKKTAELIADTWTSRASLPDNKALTVEELREAADCGIPVWLVGVGSKDQWVRIDYVESLTIGFSAFCDAETWSFCAERYGKTVFAYRRPLEKED